MGRTRGPPPLHTPSSIQEKGQFPMWHCNPATLGNVFLWGNHEGEEVLVSPPCRLTALRRWPVVAEAVGSNPAAAEEPRPVDGVVVAETGVLADVDAAVADLAQGAQAQRGQRGDAHHHEGETPAGFERRRGAREQTQSGRSSQGFSCSIRVLDAFDYRGAMAADELKIVCTLPLHSDASRCIYPIQVYAM